MILKGNQRGDGRELANHLMHGKENEHIELHELRGFAAEDLHGAMQESEAIAKGTRCKNHLFSLSLNPPQDEQVSVETFELAISRIEGELGLEGHLIRAVVIEEKRHFHEPLLRWRTAVPMEQARFLKALKDFVMAEVICSPGVQHLEFKGQTMVVSVFEALQSDPERLLPRDTHTRFTAANGDLRIISDFVAGMTDTYLLKTYERLFAPRMGSLFDRL